MEIETYAPRVTDVREAKKRTEGRRGSRRQRRKVSEARVSVEEEDTRERRASERERYTRLIIKPVKCRLCRCN